MRVFLFFSSLLITLAASLPFSGPAKAFSVERGEALFNQQCIMCHVGGGNVVDPDQNLSQEALVKYLGSSEDVDPIVNQITNGGNVMISFGGILSEEDIESIAAYVIMKARAGW